MGRINDKVAIVTGGASGIGEGIVDLFAREGAVVIAADINEEALQKADKKDNVHGMKLNVASDESWKAFTDKVKEIFGQIYILVNNASIYSEKPYTEIDSDDWEKLLFINEYEHSTGMKQIGQGFNHYSASKGAVRAISKAAATTFGKQGVRVNALFPGIIETPMTQNLSTSKKLLEQLIQATPLHRLGLPEDIANAVLFLA